MLKNKKTLIFAFILFSFVISAYCSTDCGEPGCYNSQNFPCEWTAVKCSFQYDSLIFNCLNVPQNSNLTATCSVGNNKSFSMSIFDHDNYNKYIDDDVGIIFANGAQANVMDESSKTFNMLTSGMTQSHHLIVEIQDRNLCADITCTYTIS